MPNHTNGEVGPILDQCTPEGRGGACQAPDVCQFKICHFVLFLDCFHIFCQFSEDFKTYVWTGKMTTLIFPGLNYNNKNALLVSLKSVAYTFYWLTLYKLRPPLPFCLILLLTYINWKPIPSFSFPPSISDHETIRCKYTVVSCSDSAPSLLAIHFRALETRIIPYR